MSHLGIQILYDMFNRREDTWCERVYSPWIDLDKIMREKHIPLFALESQDPVKEFDFLGITLQFEMCYTNVLQVLDLSGIPLHSADRTLEDPFVIGGGPCVYNTEPLAEFFDMFYIGEGEVVYDELLEAYKSGREPEKPERISGNGSRDRGNLRSFFYDVTYKEDGTIESFLQNNPHAKEKSSSSCSRYEPDNLSVKAGCSVYQSNPGQSGSGNPARLYPGMPFLSGGNGLPSDTSA